MQCMETSSFEKKEVLGRRGCYKSPSASVRPSDSGQQLTPRPTRQRSGTRGAGAPCFLIFILFLLVGLARFAPQVLHKQTPKVTRVGSLSAAAAAAGGESMLAMAGPPHGSYAASVSATPPIADLRAAADRPSRAAAATPVPNVAAAPATAAAAAAPAVAPAVVHQVAPQQQRPPQYARGTCISFLNEMCPPLNLSLQTPPEQGATHRHCEPIVRSEQSDLPPGAGFCAPRLTERPNPCWAEGGRTFCLPSFYILGEMKCGTTTLYQLLAKHPRIALPLTKEPRYLMRGRHEDTTVSRYAVEFESAVSRPDAITFDASPVHLSSPVAPTWLRQFLPQARLIVLVRDPVQRAYSHYKMGHEWFESKDECGFEAAVGMGLESAPEPLSAADEATVRAGVRHETSFAGLMERSLMQIHVKTCNVKPRSPSSAAAPPGSRLFPRSSSRGGNATRARLRPPPQGRPGPPWPWILLNQQRNPNGADGDAKAAAVEGDLRCLRGIDDELARRFEPEMTGRWPGAAAMPPLARAMSRVGPCSEFMMVPGNPLLKGANYAKHIETWLATFPREQLHVVHTDDLTTATQRVMNETFTHLGLPTVDVGTQSRFCVRGKSGVINVLKQSELGLHIGDNGTDGTDGVQDPTKLQVGDCENDAGNAPNVSRHSIDPQLEARLRRYYKPFNEKLYAILGRDLGW